MQCVGTTKVAGHTLPVTRECDQIQIDGVQDQLNRHQDDDYVAARENADNAEKKQGCTQYQIMYGRDLEHCVHWLLLLRPSALTPLIIPAPHSPPEALPSQSFYFLS